MITRILIILLLVALVGLSAYQCYLLTDLIFTNELILREMP